VKSPLSPWLPYFAMIALCCAFGLYIALGRPGRMHIGPMYLPSKTNAVVRSLRGDEPVMATVVLDSGLVEDAEVAPGCLVQIGDRVSVRGSPDAKPRRRLVFPAHMGIRP
jgi:hypothetical protein